MNYMVVFKAVANHVTYAIEARPISSHPTTRNEPISLGSDRQKIGRCTRHFILYNNKLSQPEANVRPHRNYNYLRGWVLLCRPSESVNGRH